MFIRMRRSTFTLITLLILVGLFGASGYSIAKVKLKIACMSAHGMSDCAKDVAEQFNKLYGPEITAEITPIGFDILLDKMLADFSTHTGSFDVWSVGQMWFGLVGRYLYDVDEIREKYPEIVDPDYDFDDFPKTLWGICATWKGKNVALPFADGQLILFYRTDLFNNSDYKAKFQKLYGYELHMPEEGELRLSYKQWYDYAEFFTTGVEWGDGEQYGISLPAKTGDPLLAVFCSLFGDHRRSPEGLKAFGPIDADWGDFFTSDHRVAFDPDVSDLGLKALNDYLALSEFSPAPTTLDWTTSPEPFKAGLTAMLMGWGGYWPSITAPGSAVRGKVAIAIPPMPHVGGWGMAINKDSKHPKEAYRYIQLLTNKKNCKYLYETYKEMPTRLSTMTDPRLKAKFPDLWYYAPALEKTSVRPRLSVYAKLEHAMGVYLGKAWTGELSAREALKATADEWNRIIKMAGL